jgi:hypothetical protein
MFFSAFYIKVLWKIILRLCRIMYLQYLSLQQYISSENKT